MIEYDLANGDIINIAAATFWWHDGRPMSAKEYLERMFRELPDMFKDYDELRALWVDTDMRKALIEKLAERG